MSLTLEIMLSVAAFGTIVVCGCAVPLMFHLQRSLDRVAVSAEEAKGDLKLLVQDTRTLLQKTSDLATRLEAEMNDVHHVVGQVRSWSDRADRLVEEVGAAIEPPLLGGARNLRLLRVGVTAFWHALVGRLTNHQPEQEEQHDQS